MNVQGKNISVSSSKGSINTNWETFVTRRWFATIRRIRQLLFAINYKVIHKDQIEHMEFFKLFQQYNIEILKTLIEKLEKIRYPQKNLKMIVAIYNMSTELFSLNIFNQILTANMLSYYGLSEEFSVNVKNSLSKLSLASQKITLVEDKFAQESDKYINIFAPNQRKQQKAKLKDVKIFTEPILNYEAQMQLSEQQFIWFYFKGGYQNYQTYDDLIDDQLVDLNEDDEPKRPIESEFIFRKGRARNITFSKRPSDHNKR